LSASRDLLIVGAGGFARETAEAVRAINGSDPVWRLVGFLDDDPALEGCVLDGTRVVGPIERLRDHPDAVIVVCVGNPSDYFSRSRIVRRLDLPLERYATLVHPSASWPKTSEIGPGSVLLASVVGTTGISIGAHVAVMPGVIFTHDDAVDDYATFGSGVRVGGGAHVGHGAYVGAGALIRERRSIGPWALVGMGAVVTRDVPEREVWIGSPARFLRRVEIPGDVLEVPIPKI
jgi:sugar O-acyltransferase (sialic acid O-acetyltransferase NeuD family)